VQIHPAPDSNVRLAPTRAGRGGIVAPFRALARSLLSWRLFRLVVLTAASSMSACIIPVGPDFQDPPPQPGSPPSISATAQYPFGSINTFQPPATGQLPPQFSANVTESDVGVPVYYRWIFDFPPWSSSTQKGNDLPISAHVDGTPINQTVYQPIDCSSIGLTSRPSNGEHRLELAVSESSFEGIPNLDTPMDGTQPAIQNWIIVISCPNFTGP
jgi:hypothetical protein